MKIGPKMAFILRVYQMTEAENAEDIEHDRVGRWSAPASGASATMTSGAARATWPAKSATVTT
jgi:hypothetical protein